MDPARLKTVGGLALAAALLLGALLLLRASPGDPPSSAPEPTAAEAPKSTTLPAYGQLPRIRATDVNGQPFELKSLRGRSFLLHFVNSSQPDALVDAANLLRVVRTLESRQELSLDKLGLVIIDLSGGSAESRRQAAIDFGLLGEKAWHVLAGPEVWPLVERTAEILKPPRSPDGRPEHPSAAMVRTSLFLLVDPSGWVRAAHSARHFDFVDAAFLSGQITNLEQLGPIPESTEEVVRNTPPSARCEWPVPK